MALEIRNLHVSIKDKEIVKGVSLLVKEGEIHAVMGPNGSGKSTLANTIMGSRNYTVTEGEIILGGQNIMSLTPDKRARLGLFMSFQYPSEIPGVTMTGFLRAAYNSLHGDLSVKDFMKLLKEKMEMLKMPKEFLSRYLNEGFSGGEKKRSEILQLAVLQPKFAILDETDSGLDIDALKTVAECIKQSAGPGVGIVLITHYQRILKYIAPHRVHVMLDGRIVKSGSKELAEELEHKGYDWLRQQVNA